MNTTDLSTRHNVSNKILAMHTSFCGSSIQCDYELRTLSIFLSLFLYLEKGVQVKLAKARKKRVFMFILLICSVLRPSVSLSHSLILSLTHSLGHTNSKKKQQRKDNNINTMFGGTAMLTLSPIIMNR